ncbi:MAG: hypothetical protein KGM15_13030 [Pseudomonadota bacterium]|nr:hypothetical protein [Pseudomonadota bacterium]
MAALTRPTLRPTAPPLDRPRLDLAGEPLRSALNGVIAGCEPLGGVERYVEALKLKAQLYADAFAGGASRLERQAFLQLCAFMPTVRRRVAIYLDEEGFLAMREGLTRLIDGDAPTCDARIASFCARYPQDKEHRFVRDIAAEVLHNLRTEQYPLMMRWVWDARSNNGVLREIWHRASDSAPIDVPDSYATFLMLREELSQYLTENGVFRDVLFYVDLLTAQVYADYISSQGGAYLRTDFTAAEDPMLHTRRMLGLDGVRPGSNRTRLKAIDGEAFVIEDVKLLS